MEVGVDSDIVGQEQFDSGRFWVRFQDLKGTNPRLIQLGLDELGRNLSSVQEYEVSGQGKGSILSFLVGVDLHSNSCLLETLTRKLVDLFETVGECLGVGVSDLLG